MIGENQVPLVYRDYLNEQQIIYIEIYLKENPELLLFKV